MSSDLSVSNVHVDVPLTNLSIQYKNMAYIAEKVLPVVSVVKESDKYYKIGREELQLDSNTAKRAPGAPAREIVWSTATETYSADEYAFSYLLPDRVRDNADAPVKPRINTTKKLTDKLLLGQEYRVANYVQNANNAGSSAAPTTLWSASTGVVIEQDIDAAKNTVRGAAGVEPTSMVLSYDVAQYVKRDSTLRDLIRYTVNGQGGWELLRNGDLPPVMFNLEIVIGGAIKQTSAEGATVTRGDIWNDNVLIYYKEASPALDSLSFGYIMRAGGFMTRTWRDERRRGEFIEVCHTQDEKIVASECAYIITSPLG